MNHEVFDVSFSIVAGGAIALATVFLTMNGAIELFKLGVWWHKERIKYKYKLSMNQPPYDEVKICRERRPFENYVMVDLIKDGKVIYSQRVKHR